ncbi:MAG: hypothetical protein KDK37_06245 [Leptospiraceae bacterium]|nr:hypothetical protein [Leptospiraceae bacterium]MCB1303856.1 hypothetical protein [Leptospiraceae bacterium]
MHSYILLLTDDDGLRSVVEGVLKEDGLRFDTATSHEPIGPEYCLIIAGPDIDGCVLEEKLSVIPGIPPRMLYLRYQHEPFKGRCARCQTLTLPMDMLKIRDFIREMMKVEFAD